MRCFGKWRAGPQAVRPTRTSLLKVVILPFSALHVSPYLGSWGSFPLGSDIRQVGARRGEAHTRVPVAVDKGDLPATGAKPIPSYPHGLGRVDPIARLLESDEGVVRHGKAKAGA